MCGGRGRGGVSARADHLDVPREGGEERSRRRRDGSRWQLAGVGMPAGVPGKAASRGADAGESGRGGAVGRRGWGGGGSEGRAEEVPMRGAGARGGEEVAFDPQTTPQRSLRPSTGRILFAPPCPPCSDASAAPWPPRSSSSSQAAHPRRPRPRSLLRPSPSRRPSPPRPRRLHRRPRPRRRHYLRPSRSTPRSLAPSTLRNGGAPRTSPTSPCAPVAKHSPGSRAARGGSRFRRAPRAIPSSRSGMGESPSGGTSRLRPRRSARTSLS